MAFQDDKRTILEILFFVRAVLDELVEGHIKEDRELFQNAWFKEVRPELEAMARRIDDILYEDSPQWAEFRSRGLTGEQLKLKRARLVAASRKGITKKILDLLNTILGSIPGADPAKEFKEFIEEGMEPNSSITSSFM